MASELKFLRELYFENLPIGPETKALKKYFTLLEKAIDNKEHVVRESFPPDDPAICGERVYKYHSAAAFKEQALRHQQITDGQSVGHSESKQAIVPSTEDKRTTTKDLARV